jgi:calcium-translocating P-type ATPase
MEIHQLSVEAALDSLGCNANGLSGSEAVRRLAEYGPNQIERIARKSVLLRLLREFVHFFSVILWIAAGLAFVAEWSAPGQGMAKIGFALIGVILVSGLFAFWQEHRVEHTLDALLKLLPQQATLLRDSDVVRAPVDAVVPGDIVLLDQGDIVPADCRLIESVSLRVNNATVTGESMPQARDAGPSKEEELLSGRNVLLAGTSIAAGSGRAVVFATGLRTEFGKIARLAQTSATEVSPLRKQLAHLSRLIAALAVGIGLLFFAIGAAIDMPIWQDVIFAIGIIASMVPEGLLPTLTLALALAAQRLAKRNVLIRHLASVETLGSATVICTDKTGTLTQNRMRAHQLLLGSESYAAATVANQPEIGQRFSSFFEAANFCHDLKETHTGGRQSFLGDPMEAALVEMARGAVAEFPVLHRLAEIPFDSDRMRHSVLCEAGNGPVLYCKGAPESVLSICHDTLNNGRVEPLTEASRRAIVDAQEAMAGNGLRTLAYAMGAPSSSASYDPVEADMTFLGLVGLEDPPHPEVPEAIRKCGEAGIKVIMVTGDHPQTAVAIARQIGLVQSRDPAVVSGDQVRDLSDRELDSVLTRPEVIFSRATADQKMRIVTALKRSGHIVAMTGDGVNDAPALKTAHIGVAMGIAGTEVARAAADMVLLDDNFASIVNAVEEGRAVFQNIRKFLTYVLVHNVAELIPYLAFVLFRIPLPLTPIQILTIDMATDSVTALGLGIEEAHPQAMQRPPRSQKERLMNLALALRAYLFLGLIEAAAAMAAFFFALKSGGWTYGQSLASTDPVYLRATTACLSAIIVLQSVNVFLCRSSVQSVWTRRFLSNRLILWGVGLEIVSLLLINYTPWGNLLLETAPVPAELWLLLIPCAIGMVVLEELRKWAVRRGLRPDQNFHRLRVAR